MILFHFHSFSCLAFTVETLSLAQKNDFFFPNVRTFSYSRVRKDIIGGDVA